MARKIGMIHVVCVITFQLVQSTSGKASCPDKCPTDVYNPVCGSDGKTYPNLCRLEVLKCNNNDPNLSVAHNGECKKCPQICNKDFQPVCGSDGKTYSNRCVFEVIKCNSNNVGLSVAHGGKCKECPQFCPPIYQPVCGSDAKTYPNRCRLEAIRCKSNDQVLRIAHKGECRKCPKICPAVYEPVCGTDGKTYSNLCSLEARGCTIGHKTLAVAHRGGCGKCSKLCPFVFQPVCGSNQKTYPNKCYLEVAACKRKDKALKVVYQGKCKKCPKLCSIAYLPVCGSDEYTYINECTLNWKACQKKENLTVAHKGKCAEKIPIQRSLLDELEPSPEGKCNFPCPRILAPVCGTDGKTYSNECVLRFKSCESGAEFKVAHDGDCEIPNHHKRDFSNLETIETKEAENQSTTMTENDLKYCLEISTSIETGKEQECLPTTVKNSCKPDALRKLRKYVEEGHLKQCPGTEEVDASLVGTSVLPPNFLSIDGHRSCLNSHNPVPGALFTVVCLPVVKPDTCKDDAWEKLTKEVKDERIKNC